MHDGELAIGRARRRVRGGCDRPGRREDRGRDVGHQAHAAAAGRPLAAVGGDGVVVVAAKEAGVGDFAGGAVGRRIGDVDISVCHGIKGLGWGWDDTGERIFPMLKGGRPAGRGVA